MIISLVRLKTINEFTRAVNPTKDIVQLCMWSGIEIDVGVICPCLPSFRLLLRKMWPRLVGTSGNAGTGGKYEMRSRTNTQGMVVTANGRTSMVRQATVVRSSSSRSITKKNGGSDEGGNGHGNIIKTTEVGVEFEIVRSSTVGSRGGESMASVTALGDSDGDSIHHHGHGDGHGEGDGNRDNRATSFV